MQKSQSKNKYRTEKFGIIMGFVSFVVIVSLVCIFAYVTDTTVSCSTGVISPGKWKQIKVGMTKQDVIKKLGKPIKIYRRKKGQKTVKYQLPTYGHSDCVKANEIYTYATSLEALYIYIDEEGKVIGWTKAGT